MIKTNGRLLVAYPTGSTSNSNPKFLWVGLVLHELQHCDLLFANTLFEVLPFRLVQLGFEYALVAINVLLMCTQLNYSCFHNATLKYPFKTSTHFKGAG